MTRPCPPPNNLPFALCCLTPRPGTRSFGIPSAPLPVTAVLRGRPRPSLRGRRHFDYSGSFSLRRFVPRRLLRFQPRSEGPVTGLQGSGCCRFCALATPHSRRSFSTVFVVRHSLFSRRDFSFLFCLSLCAHFFPSFPRHVVMLPAASLDRWPSCSAPSGHRFAGLPRTALLSAQLFWLAVLLIGGSRGFPVLCAAPAFLGGGSIPPLAFASI